MSRIAGVTAAAGVAFAASARMAVAGSVPAARTARGRRTPGTRVDVPPASVIAFVPAASVIMIVTVPTAAASRHNNIIVDPGLAAIIDIAPAPSASRCDTTRRTDLEGGCY
jgi:hypothetical protein